ncbi:MAG: hypothetical protein ACLSA6_16420 [Holdemania massiliensis]
MALQCSDNTEPSAWENPPIERHLIKTVREQMPAFNKGNRQRRWEQSLKNLRRRDGIVFHHPNSCLCCLGQICQTALQSPVAAFSVV